MIGGFEFFRNYKGWLGCQGEVGVSGKYRANKQIKWGKPCIMLMNDNPYLLGHVDLEWLEGNANIIHIEDQLVSILPTSTEYSQSESTHNQSDQD